MSFTKVAPAGIGTSPGTSIRIGDSLLHSTGLDIGTGSGIGVTIRQHGNATFTGIVTATSFVGALTGNVTGTIQTAAQPNITSVGTLSSLNVSGNIGVGGTLTYEDVTNIDSVGVITARTDINLGDSIIHVGDTNTKIRFPAADTISAETAGSERVRIDSTGRMIIGTVMTAGTGTYYDDITINNSNQSGSAGGTGIDLISKSDNYGAIVFSNESQHERGYIKFEHNSGTNKLRFGTLGADRWQIYSAGHLQPAADSAYDIGSNAVRVRNVYADTLYGDGSNLTGISGVTINNNANNRLITGSGTANTLEAESTLTYDGNQLKFGAGSGPTSSGGYYDDIKIDNSDNSSGEAGGTGIEFISGNQSWVGLIFSDSDTAQQAYVKYSHIDDYMTFAAANAERLRIYSDKIQALNCTGAFEVPKGTTAQRPTAASGMIRYNSTESELEMHNGTEWLAIKTIPNTITLYYLVIGGGGAGGGNYRAGGGGAGAYRTNWNNESQGGGQSAASGFTVNVASTPTYSVVIGAGGAASSGNSGGAGGGSTFATITANGGTGGARYEQAAPTNSGNGSGGGGGGQTGTLRAGASGGTYGYAGGAGSDNGSYQCGGGGGGAGGAGIQGNYSTSRSNAGDGGSALASSITGSSVLRAGGGGAGAYGGGNNNGGGVNNGPAGGGGGAGRGAYAYRDGEAATANTGSGGGGSPGSAGATGGNGGSGIIILRYSNVASASYTSGVTYSRSTIGSDIVDTITATSNSSQTVTFS